MELGLAYSEVTTKSCFRKETVGRYMEESNWVDWRSLVESQEEAFSVDEGSRGGVLFRPGRPCPV